MFACTTSLIRVLQWESCPQPSLHHVFQLQPDVDVLGGERRQPTESRWRDAVPQSPGHRPRLPYQPWQAPTRPPQCRHHWPYPDCSLRQHNLHLDPLLPGLLDRILSGLLSPDWPYPACALGLYFSRTSPGSGLLNSH